MTTNQSPQYLAAQKIYLEAKTKQERLNAMEEMIRTMPQHKSAEAMRANLRTRYKKLKESLEKGKKTGSSKKGIKKQDMQAIILGFPNTGKSSLFNILTNQKTEIKYHAFSTLTPILGTSQYEDIKIQIIDMPAFPNSDSSLINTIDTIILVIDNLNQIEQAKQFLQKSNAKIILIYNKSDLLNETEKRKLNETLKSKYKKFDFFILSCINPEKEAIIRLKKEIFSTFPIIRAYTKEPHKAPSEEPMILKKDSTLKDAAEKILKGMSSKIKRARVWGPSSKFPGQVIGLDHPLKDKDIIEFQTK